MRSIARASAVVIALLCAPVAHAAVESKSTHTTYQVRRGSTNLPPAPTNEEECIRRAHEAADTEGLTRESGANDFQCHNVLHVVTRFGPNPTCPPLPPPEGRVVDCPAGFTGAYTQTLSYSPAPFPTCSIAGEWLPTTPPASCVPIDSDNDGVPDSEDECPTVYAAGGPNGCPATPPSEWTFCANEWQLCAFEGTRRVRYGAGSTWVERDVTASGGGVQCRNSVFGDPLEGTVKRCELLSGSPEPEAPAACVGRICRVSWTPDEPPVADGYRIVYGRTPDGLVNTVQVTPGATTSAEVTMPETGVWYFGVMSFVGGTSSPLSNIVVRTVR